MARVESKGTAAVFCLTAGGGGGGGGASVGIADPMSCADARASPLGRRELTVTLPPVICSFIMNLPVGKQDAGRSSVTQRSEIKAAEREGIEGEQ